MIPLWLTMDALAANPLVTIIPQMQNSGTGPGYYTGTGSGTLYLAAPMLESGANPTAYIANNTNAPVTLTDYTLSGTTVTLAQAPASTATTQWQGRAT